MLFLHLTRLIGEEAHPVLINADHIVSMYPAVSFGHYGQPIFADSGTDIWTLLEATGNNNAIPWRVTQSMDEILRLLPSGVA